MGDMTSLGLKLGKMNDLGLKVGEITIFRLKSRLKCCLKRPKMDHFQAKIGILHAENQVRYTHGSWRVNIPNTTGKFHANEN